MLILGIGFTKLLSHEDHTGALAWGDEQWSILGGLGQYKNNSSTDEGFLMSSWSGEDLRIHRKEKGRSGFVKDVCLNIVMNATPQTFDEILAGDREHSGFYARFLFTAPPDLKTTRYTPGSDMDPKVMDYYMELCRRLDQMSGIFVLDSPSEERYTQYDNMIADKIDHGLDDTENAVLSKSRNYVLRFALLISAMRIASSDQPEEMIVNCEDMQKAVQIMEHYNSINSNVRTLQLLDSIDDSAKQWDKEKKKAFVLKLAEAKRLNKSKTAKSLAVSRPTINRWIKK